MVERWGDGVRERLRKFGLELHPDKTRRIEFGRNAEQNRKRRAVGKPETFNFLGFTHISGKDRNGNFTVKRRTIRKRMRAKLSACMIRWRRQANGSSQSSKATSTTTRSRGTSAAYGSIEYG
jgi:hypothetical protein